MSTLTTKRQAGQTKTAATQKPVTTQTGSLGGIALLGLLAGGLGLLLQGEESEAEIAELLPTPAMLTDLWTYPNHTNQYWMVLEEETVELWFRNGPENPGKKVHAYKVEHNYAFLKNIVEWLIDYKCDSIQEKIDQIAKHYKLNIYTLLCSANPNSTQQINDDGDRLWVQPGGHLAVFRHIADLKYYILEPLPKIPTNLPFPEQEVYDKLRQADFVISPSGKARLSEYVRKIMLPARDPGPDLKPSTKIERSSIYGSYEHAVTTYEYEGHNRYFGWYFKTDETGVTILKGNTPVHCSSKEQIKSVVDQLIDYVCSATSPIPKNKQVFIDHATEQMMMYWEKNRLVN